MIREPGHTFASESKGQDRAECPPDHEAEEYAKIGLCWLRLNLCFGGSPFDLHVPFHLTIRGVLRQKFSHAQTYSHQASDGRQILIHRDLNQDIIIFRLASTFHALLHEPVSQ